MKDIYNPDYYKTGKIEVSDYIEDKGFNFFLGNVVKYVSRAGKKDGNSAIQDLRKASWYLNKEIARQEQLHAEEGNKRCGHSGECITTYPPISKTTSESEEIETEYPYTEDDFEFKEGKDYDDDDEGDEPLG